MNRLVCLLVLFLLWPQSQDAQDSGGGRSLSDKEKMGRKIFIQRCSVCHLGLAPKYETYAPILDQQMVASLGDTKVREKIMDGSPRMPGWKYTFKPAEVDDIIAYLKTVEKDKAIMSSLHETEGILPALLGEPSAR